MKPEAIKKYAISYAKNDKGEDVKRSFILSFSRPIQDEQMAAKVSNLFGHQVAGIDGFKVIGRYSVQLLVAETFDPDEVVAVLQAELDVILSDIIQPGKPKLVTP